MEDYVQPATVEEVVRLFKGAGGKWAGEQMMKAAREGRELSPAVLRTADTLRHEEWLFLDDALTSEALIRLQAVADLISRGLTKPIPNSMGKTVYGYEKVTFMDPATVSMDGVTRTNNDRQEFLQANLPIPITHKDFFIHLRTLIASRNRGESLDTTQVSTAGRVVMEAQEKMLLQGGKTFGGLPLYGYTTHPNRNTLSFGTNGAWTN